MNDYIITNKNIKLYYKMSSSNSVDGDNLSSVNHKNTFMIIPPTNIDDDKTNIDNPIFQDIDISDMEFKIEEEKDDDVSDFHSVQLNSTPDNEIRSRYSSPNNTEQSSPKISAEEYCIVCLFKYCY